MVQWLRRSHWKVLGERPVFVLCLAWSLPLLGPLVVSSLQIDFLWSPWIMQAKRGAIHFLAPEAICLWWVILCVSLAGPRCSDMWPNTLLGISVMLISEWDAHWNQRVLSRGHCLPWHWWAMSNQLKELHKKRLSSSPYPHPGARRNSACRSIQTQTVSLHPVPRLRSNLQILDLHLHKRMSQSLKINVYISIVWLAKLKSCVWIQYTPWCLQQLCQRSSSRWGPEWRRAFLRERLSGDIQE